MTNPKIAVYLRQSADRDQTELGIDRQRREVDQLLDARGWTAEHIYIDNDTSATSTKPRPQFEEMMTAVREGRVQVIVVRHLDRLVRRMADLERVLADCDKAGAHIVSASDGVDTSTDGGRLVARLLGSIAQGEVERKSARQRAAVMQAAEQGRWVGGRRAFGYEADGVTVRESEARYVRQAVADVLAGESSAGIAREWNKAGLTTSRGNKWTRSAVRDVLGNPRIAGLRRHRPAEDRKHIRSYPLDGIVGRAEWPGLVDEDTWRAMVRVMFPPERVGRTGGTKRLLTGVALCGVCGQGVHAGGASHGNDCYRCVSMRHFNRLAAPVDDFVQKVAVARLQRPDALDLFVTDDGEDVQALSAEADVLRSRIDQVAEDYADGILDRSQVKTVGDRLRGRLMEVENRIGAAMAGDAVGDLLVDPASVAEKWAGLSLARRRSLIGAMMTPVIHPVGRGVRTFRPESVGIVWREGD